MDPFARKMIYGSFLYGGMMLAMFAVLTVVYLHSRPRCSDRIAAESTSPGNQWTATIMERRCGAEEPFFTHVNLRSAGKDMSTGFFSGLATEGEVFVIEEDAAGSGISLNWSSPATLSIACPRCSASMLRKHDERWGGVVIQYQMSQAIK